MLRETTCGVRRLEAADDSRLAICPALLLSVRVLTCLPILPVNPQSGEKCLGSIEEQTLQVLENVDAILNAAGSSRDRVLKTTVYVSDINLWDKVNTVYSEFFLEHRPARAVVPTRDLHYGFKIEIEAIAYI